MPRNTSKRLNEIYIKIRAFIEGMRFNKTTTRTANSVDTATSFVNAKQRRHSDDDLYLLDVRGLIKK